MAVKDTEKLIEYALIGVGLYIAYQIYTDIKNVGTASYTAAQNFDQNIGLGPFDAWVSSFFAPPASTPP